jgi:hypothetical protein
MTHLRDAVGKRVKDVIGRDGFLLSSCDCDLLMCSDWPRLDWKRARLPAPCPDDLKGFSLSDPVDFDEFLTGFRIHRTNDDCFLRSRTDSEEDSASLSRGLAWRRCRHAEFSPRLHIAHRIDSTVSVLKEFADEFLPVRPDLLRTRYHIHSACEKMPPFLLLA